MHTCTSTTVCWHDLLGKKLAKIVMLVLLVLATLVCCTGTSHNTPWKVNPARLVGDT
jgi:hypothetical protein